ACINFMNLSTAQASRKLKQVGIKKVIGANRKTLIYQYVGEAMILTFLASCLAIIMVYFFIPGFNSMTDKQLGLTLDGNFISGVLIITFFTGLLSGSYPAFYLSRFKPMDILKGKFSSSIGELWTRKGLVVFQFCISILLIVAVSVIYQQIDFVQSENLGYKKDNVIVFDRQQKLYDNLEVFLAEVNNLPGVESSSVIEDEVTDISGNTGVYAVQGQTSDEIPPRMYEAVVGYDFIETLSIEMSEGRPFSRKFSNEGSKIILNEMAVEILGITDPVGTIISWKRQDKEVIGVTKNFHGQSLYEEIKPMAILHEPDETTKVLVRIQSGTERATISKLKNVYESYYPGLPFEFQFLDDEYRALYVSEQRIAMLFRYFAGIAIIISCLGLFGLASFSAERRLKEIGIRKILGSTNFGIVSLLSRDFLLMIIIANVITLPLSYLLSRKWLDNFAYSIDLTWWYFIGAGLSALLIALLTVSFQTFKAAYVNPVVCLRDE
ncbi:MAG: FtsX-like permease family protein, partial [Bacteroidota bacterium]